MRNLGQKSKQDHSVHLRKLTSKHNTHVKTNKVFVTVLSLKIDKHERKMLACLQ